MTTPSIRKVLSANIGKVLTPELACEIELAAISGDEQVINTESLGCVLHQGYEIRAERFADIVHELHPLHQAHWLETEKYRHGLQLNPDYLRYAAIEKAGGMVQFTVRKAGALVGNMRMFIASSLHTQTPVATEDTIFLLPEHRGGFLVMALLRFAEQALTSIGIREIRSNSKLVNRADVLLRRMGYEPFGIQMVKFYQGASDVR